MCGKNALIRSDLLLDGVIFISGVLDLLVLLVFELVEPVLQQCILLSVFLGLLSNLVQFCFFFFEQVLCTFLGDFELLQVSGMLELDFL
jgi:hypothetical protein